MQSEAGMGVGILVLLLIILLMFLAKVEPPLTLKQEAVTAELIE
jgi:septal ring-binding cell division protein DamX